MAQLPGERYLIQQIDQMVVLFERHTEAEVVRFDPTDPDATAKAQQTIHDSPELGEEEKAFAHFWSGYFYAHATGLAFLQANPS